MTISKAHAGLAVILVSAIAGGFVWQVRVHVRLRANADEQLAQAAGSTAAFERQIVTENHRLSAAAATVAALQSRLEAARVVAAAPVTISPADALKETVSRARELITDGKLAEALEEYVSCYRELQAVRPASGECQNLMTGIQSLGRRYPPAMTALVELRDAAVAQRQGQPDRRELVSEIALLNERLGEGHRTIALYDSLPPGDLSRQGLAMTARASFIKARRYSDALLGRSAGMMLTFLETGARQIEQRDSVQQASIRKSLIAETLTNIEVLTGAGNFDDARMLTEKLFAFDSSEPTRAQLKEHLERASPAPP
jgi:hypothetical protein